MNAQEIIAAAHVRELAIQIRKTAATREKDRADESQSGPTAGMSYNDFLALYNQTHPLSEFVPDAIAQLKEIHAVICQQP